MSQAELLARIVKECIDQGHPVQLDGLGILRPDARRAVAFVAETGPRIFIAYAAEDAPDALALADALEAAGMRPWIDRRKLLPGQDWRRCIERAIQRSDFFVACFSRHSARKRGQFQSELRRAIQCAERMPLGDLFIMPVRLGECSVPPEISAQLQSVDLYPDWDAGVEKLLESIRQEMAARRQRDVA